MYHPDLWGICINVKIYSKLFKTHSLTNSRKKQKITTYIKCLRDKGNCLAITGTGKMKSNVIQTATKEINLQFKDSCKFPFKYKNVDYNYCTKSLNQDEFLCGTSLGNTGVCSDLCPLENEICECDVLHIESDGPIGNQNFTKQNDTRNGKPHYFSIQQNMIYWTNSYWSYEEYDAYSKRFRFGQIYPSRFLSNGNGCKNTTQFFHFLGTVVKIKCLKYNSQCSATRMLSAKQIITKRNRLQQFRDVQEVQFQAKVWIL